MLLGLDSASGACSAALGDGTAVAAHRFEAMHRGQAEALAPMIADVLADAHREARDVDAFAVTVGPGAFTGVRIGLSAARALALACAKPLIGVTTFAAVAEPWLGDHGSIVSVIESRRDDFFFQLIDRATGTAGPPRAAHEADVLGHLHSDGYQSEPILLCGDGAARLMETNILRDLAVTVADGDGLPDARQVIAVAARQIAQDGLPDRRERPQPLYLRPPDVGPKSVS